MKPEQRRLQRLRNGRYRNDKNPRKAKKAMKKVVIASLMQDFSHALDKIKFRVHWVPNQGWTVTSTERRKHYVQ